MPEIVIKLKPGSKPRRRNQPRRGVLPDRRESEILSRRKSNFINFYDLGQLNAGTVDSPIWQDLNFQDVRSLTISGTPLHPTGTVAFGLTGWTNLKDKIFEIGIDDWKNKYRRLDFENAEKYYVDLYTGDGSFSDNATKFYSIARANSRANTILETADGRGWNENGLKLDASPNKFYVYATSLFAGIPETDTKVTNSANYSDPSVSLDVGKKADVYLVPWPIFHQGSDGSIATGFTHTGYLNLFFEIISRSLFLDAADLTAWYHAYVDASHPIASPFAGANYEAVEHVAGELSTIFNSAKSYSINRPNARYYRSGTGFVDPLTFPLLSHWALQYGSYSVNNFTSATVKLEAGSLLAVIRKPGQDYYVWSSTQVVKNVALRLTNA